MEFFEITDPAFRPDLVYYGDLLFPWHYKSILGKSTAKTFSEDLDGGDNLVFHDKQICQICDIKVTQVTNECWTLVTDKY